MHVADSRNIRLVVDVAAEDASACLAGEWIRLHGIDISKAERAGNAVGTPLVIHANVERILIVAGDRIVQEIVRVACPWNIGLRKEIDHIQRSGIEATSTSGASPRGSHARRDDVAREGGSLRW